MPSCSRRTRVTNTACEKESTLSAYSANNLIDTAHGVIPNVEAKPAKRTAEVESTRVIVGRIEERFNLTPELLVASTSSGTAAKLGCMVDEKSIAPHVPVWD